MNAFQVSKRNRCALFYINNFRRQSIWNNQHGFKNQIKLANSTGSIENWTSIQSGYSQKPKTAGLTVKPKNGFRLTGFADIWRGAETVNFSVENATYFLDLKR